jgi:hypothetical protein
MKLAISAAGVRHGLALGLILGIDDLAGFVFVVSAEARPFSGLVVDAIEATAPKAAGLSGSVILS